MAAPVEAPCRRHDRKTWDQRGDVWVCNNCAATICRDCGHETTQHTRGGMCAGRPPGSVCHCVRMWSPEWTEAELREAYGR